MSLPLDHSGMAVLGMDECLDRLRKSRVGRLAFMERGEPMILPVNHGMDGNCVIIRTAPGSKLLAAEYESPVAYEVDGFDADRRAGWSVVVRGVAATVDDPAELAGLSQLGAGATQLDAGAGSLSAGLQSAATGSKELAAGLAVAAAGSQQSLSAGCSR